MYDQTKPVRMRVAITRPIHGFRPGERHDLEQSTAYGLIRFGAALPCPEEPTPAPEPQWPLVGWIQQRGGSVTAREVCRQNRQYPSVQAAETALDELVQAGLGRWWTDRPGRKGGRPTRRFILNDPAA